ncbi:MAG: OmpH family outer membrane protein, partial [Paludibacteraceae bacterium]|nr:OmpH family outer membrane protein [Paludibacteraceae bacterium]
MKKTLLVLCAMAISTMAGFAQKFALVDMEYILKNIPAFESASQQLEQSSKKWQKEIDALNEEANVLYKNYQAEMVFLSDEQKKERER